MKYSADGSRQSSAALRTLCTINDSELSKVLKGPYHRDEPVIFSGASSTATCIPET